MMQDGGGFRRGPEWRQARAEHPALAGLLDALTAPADAQELGREEQARAMFRARPASRQVPPRPRRPGQPMLATLAVLAITTGGGITTVAAGAMTGRLLHSGPQPPALATTAPPSLPTRTRPATDYRPTDHEPTDHEPADHEPADHEPADHEPADHGPADHRPAGRVTDPGGPSATISRPWPACGACPAPAWTAPPSAGPPMFPPAGSRPSPWVGPPPPPAPSGSAPRPAAPNSPASPPDGGHPKKSAKKPGTCPVITTDDGKKPDQRPKCP